MRAKPTKKHYEFKYRLLSSYNIQNSYLQVCLQLLDISYMDSWNLFLQLELESLDFHKLKLVYSLYLCLFSTSQQVSMFKEFQMEFKSEQFL